MEFMTELLLFINDTLPTNIRRLIVIKDCHLHTGQTDDVFFKYQH